MSTLGARGAGRGSQGGAAVDKALPGIRLGVPSEKGPARQMRVSLKRPLRAAPMSLTSCRSTPVRWGESSLLPKTHRVY